MACTNIHTYKQGHSSEEKKSTSKIYSYLVKVREYISFIHIPQRPVQNASPPPHPLKMVGKLGKKNIPCLKIYGNTASYLSQSCWAQSRYPERAVPPACGTVCPAAAPRPSCPAPGRPKKLGISYASFIIIVAIHTKIICIL